MESWVGNIEEIYDGFVIANGKTARCDGCETQGVQHSETCLNKQRFWAASRTGEGVVNMHQAPQLPTILEQERHRVTHMPFASWCDACVRGKAAE